jgi:hypothetical protein
VKKKLRALKDELAVSQWYPPEEMRVSSNGGPKNIQTNALEARIVQIFSVVRSALWSSDNYHIRWGMEILAANVWLNLIYEY